MHVYLSAVHLLLVALLTSVAGHGTNTSVDFSTLTGAVQFLSGASAPSNKSSSPSSNVPIGDATKASDHFVLRTSWRPSRCLSPNEKTLMCGDKMPPEWRQQLIVKHLAAEFSPKICGGKSFDAALAPQAPSDKLVFPEFADFKASTYEAKYRRYGDCTEMDQATYWIKAVQLGREVNAKLPKPMPKTITADELQKLLGPHTALTCLSYDKTILWDVDFCYARKKPHDVGEPTPCGAVSPSLACKGSIILLE